MSFPHDKQLLFGPKQSHYVLDHKPESGESLVGHRIYCWTQEKDMAYIEIIWHSVWPYLEEHMIFLQKERKRVPLKNKPTRIGINISLILTSACCIEGRVEQELKELIRHRNSVIRGVDVEKLYERRILNSVMHNLEDYLNSRVERTTGIENFGSFLELLSYKRTPAKFSDYPNWEAIRVLFNFRNVLAHGRECSGKRTKAWWVEGDWKDDFAGGYKLTEDYLFKKKLIKNRFISKGSIEHLFTNRVADHFVAQSKGFCRHISRIIGQEKKRFNISNIKGI